MNRTLKFFNTLTKEKEVFKPIVEGHIGMYVCGPTVYSDVHLGNCRTFVSFDMIYRYLLFIGYKVRYVRNITDVGHLEGDVDTGAEDKISKKARLEQLEPMEIAQRYTNGFHEMMRKFNTLDPSIEPRATGHIPEQIKMVERILQNGYGYEVYGSVYFDTLKLSNDTGLYGKLSGRIIEDLMVETRDDLKNQSEKRHASDFAIWIKADESHIMKWESPWSVGFPGWHLECSAMSTKYLGEHFDIHGGGGDLVFPHHENEIAQNFGACKCTPANFWLHGNMLLLNGKKMSKSDGNSITPVQLFTGDSPHISKGYNPMTLRFFMLQSHFRSTLDLTDNALLAAEKGYNRLMEAWGKLRTMEGKANAQTELDKEIAQVIEAAFQDMDDDFNTPKAMARLFDLAGKINSIKDGHISADAISQDGVKQMQQFFHDMIFEIFGLKETGDISADDGVVDGLMQLIIDLRQKARANKDFATSDQIRDALQEVNIQLKDSKDGTSWVKA